MKNTTIFFAVILAFYSTVYASENIIIEKNLFSPDRSPPDSTTTNTQSPDISVKLKDIRLDGIIFYNNSKIAVLKVKGKLINLGKNSSYVAVKEGESIGPYKIVKIEKNMVIVNHNGEQHNILLYEPGKKAPPPPPPPPPTNTSGKSFLKAEKEMDFPSPEEFKKLSPREKEKLIKRMRQVFLKKLEKAGIEKLKSTKRETDNEK